MDLRIIKGIQRMKRSAEEVISQQLAAIYLSTRYLPRWEKGQQRKRRKMQRMMIYGQSRLLIACWLFAQFTWVTPKSPDGWMDIWFFIDCVVQKMETLCHMRTMNILRIFFMIFWDTTNLGKRIKCQPHLALWRRNIHLSFEWSQLKVANFST